MKSLKSLILEYESLHGGGNKNIPLRRFGNFVLQGGVGGRNRVNITRTINSTWNEICEHPELQNMNSCTERKQQMMTHSKDQWKDMAKEINEKFKETRKIAKIQKKNCKDRIKRLNIKNRLLKNENNQKGNDEEVAMQIAASQLKEENNQKRKDEEMAMQIAGSQLQDQKLDEEIAMQIAEQDFLDNTGPDPGNQGE